MIVNTLANVSFDLRKSIMVSQKHNSHTQAARDIVRNNPTQARIMKILLVFHNSLFVTNRKEAIIILITNGAPVGPPNVVFGRNKGPNFPSETFIPSRRP